MTIEAFEYIPWRGATCDRKLVEFLKIIERRLGHEIDVIKGHSVSSSSGVSSTTHNKGGIADLTSHNEVKKLKAIIDLGGFGWIRPAIPGKWERHMHIGIRNHGNLDPAAARQQTSFDLGRDGLISNLLDTNTYRNPSAPKFSYDHALEDNKNRKAIVAAQKRIVTARQALHYRP